RHVPRGGRRPSAGCRPPPGPHPAPCAVTLGTQPGPIGDTPLGPYALLPQLPLDTPPVGQPVDETQPSPDLRPLVVSAQHDVIVATIAHRDPEEIVDQIENDRDIGSHMSHHVAHELGDDNA